MTLEAKLDELIEVNKAILVALQTGAQMAAPAPAAAGETAQETEAKKGRGRPRKEDAAVAPAAAPATETPAATPPAPAATEPSATPAPATASAAPSVSFKEVTEAIVRLNKDTGPNGGRPGVLKVLQHFLGTTEGKRVPDLEPLGKNAEIVAFVEAALKPAEDDDLGI